MEEPGSAILSALYQQRRDEARRLADSARELSVWEAAALGRDEELGRLITGEPALANAWGPDGYTPLMLAGFFARGTTTALLLAHGANPHAAARNSMQVQPLHAAVAAGNVESAELLLRHGARTEARQQGGYTPLMGAAAAGRQDLVDLLLEHGAETSAISDEGKTAAAIARERGHDALAASLEGSA